MAGRIFRKTSAKGLPVYETVSQQLQESFFCNELVHKLN
tara:strand:- start:499 stop:615 length:117 start_codon:yes stop_codon:yes gene_type:complete